MGSWTGPGSRSSVCASVRTTSPAPRPEDEDEAEYILNWALDPSIKLVDMGDVYADDEAGRVLVSGVPGLLEAKKSGKSPVLVHPSCAMFVFSSSFRICIA